MVLGLGKLGLPVALAIEDKGHNIIGYDINPNIEKILKNKKLPYKEKGASELLIKSNIEFQSIENLVKNSDDFCAYTNPS